MWRLAAVALLSALLVAGWASERGSSRPADPARGSSPSARDPERDSGPPARSRRHDSAGTADRGTRRRRLFNGDYQTGTFDQWPGKNLPAGAADVGAGIGPVPAPRRYPKVARFTLGLGGPRDRRTEVLRHPVKSDGAEGVETWWRWYILFPNGFREPPNGDLILSDWHNTVSGCAPLAIFDALRGGGLVLRLRAGTTRIQTWGSVAAPELDPGYEGRTFTNGHRGCETQVDRRYSVIPRIRRNHWYEILLHVKWTSRTRGGFFDVFVDGCRRTPPPSSPRRAVATLMDRKWGQVFFKQGIYDPHGWPRGARPSTVYYTGTRQLAHGERLLRGCDPRALRR